MPTPYLDFGGNGEELVFLHANGYPPACYYPLFASLANYFHVTAMVQRPLWPGSKPEEFKNWGPLTDDLLRFLDAHQTKPVLCVGHSMGGTALLRAALHEPERFQVIVLLDPVLFPPSIVALWNVLFALHLGRRFHPLITTARQRRSQFDDLDRLFTGYRRKPIFRYMSDEALHTYIGGIACQQDNRGYQLCYSVEWEVQIYATGIRYDMDIWRNLSRLKVPTYIIRGVETDTFWERTGNLVKRKQPRIQVDSLAKSTHLLPLERPGEISNRIQSFFEENA